LMCDVDDIITEMTTRGLLKIRINETLFCMCTNCTTVLFG